MQFYSWRQLPLGLDLHFSVTHASAYYPHTLFSVSLIKSALMAFISTKMLMTSINLAFHLIPLGEVVAC